MKNLFFVIILLLIGTSCSDSKKENEMTPYDKATLFKKNNPVGEKLGFGDVILDSIIIFGDENVDSIRICLLHSKISDLTGAFCSSFLANLKDGELIDGLNISTYNYCNNSGEKVRTSRTSILYDNKYWVAYRDCRNAEHMQIMMDVLGAKKFFPKRLDEFTTASCVEYFPEKGIYVCCFTLSGGFDNDALDYNKIGSRIKKNTMRQLKLLTKESKELYDFYKMLERQNILIKYAYFSASTNKLFFTFSIKPTQLLKR